MSRQLRFDPPGGFHHVMHRGSRRQVVFRDHLDRHDFLQRVAETAQRFALEIHGFALMDNHYHLLVRSLDAGLSPAMRFLNSTYAQSFNKRHGFDGHLFRGRFRSLLVGDDLYLVELARYIHRNPVAAGLTARARAFPWSSHRGYVGAERRWPWVRTDEVLAYFGNSRPRFEAFVDAPDTAAARGVIEAVDRGDAAIGSEEFIRDLQADAPPDEAFARSLARLRSAHLDAKCRRARRAVVAAGGGPEMQLNVAVFVLSELGVDHTGIARALELPSPGSVSMRLHRLRTRRHTDATVDRLIVAARAAVVLDPAA